MDTSYVSFGVRAQSLPKKCGIQLGIDFLWTSKCYLTYNDRYNDRSWTSRYSWQILFCNVLSTL